MHVPQGQYVKSLLIDQLEPEPERLYDYDEFDRSRETGRAYPQQLAPGCPMLYSTCKFSSNLQLLSGSSESIASAEGRTPFVTYACIVQALLSRLAAVDRDFCCDFDT